MTDGLKLLHRVTDRMNGFMAGRKSATRDAFSGELEHNLSYEASNIEPAPTDTEIEHVREAVSARYASRLTSF